MACPVKSTGVNVPSGCVCSAASINVGQAVVATTTGPLYYYSICNDLYTWKNYAISNGKNVGTLAWPTNYQVTIDMTATGVVSNWGNIIHVTNGNDCCSPCNRVFAVWFNPGNLDLLVVTDQANRGNVYQNSIPGTVQGVRVKWTITAVGLTVSMYKDGATTAASSLTVASARCPSANYITYLCDPWYMTAQITLHQMSVVALP